MKYEIILRQVMRWFFLKPVNRLFFFSLSILISGVVVEVSNADEITNKKVEELTHTIGQLKQDIAILKEQKNGGDKNKVTGGNFDRYHFGGYGEMHANFNLDTDINQFDFHRMVFFTGYDFNDWISFDSELEIEHAFVSDGAGGEVVFEQAYIDVDLNKAISIRAGRLLTPVGLINRKHEPTSFNGVERPLFATYIIPSTWSSDGAGIFGNPIPMLSYELYVVNGLDGSKFGSTSGIRNGRMKERPGLNAPAITGRIDLHFLSQHFVESNQILRLGLSGFYGGLNNGNKGIDPEIDGNIGVYAADFEYSLNGLLDFKGEIAFEQIENADHLSTVTGDPIASTIFGWYLESGYHFWPDKFKNGRLSKSDAVVFLRFEDVDTQHEIPSGLQADPKGDRTQWTVGINFYPVPNLVAKIDYQILDDATGNRQDLFNFGFGWSF